MRIMKKISARLVVSPKLVVDLAPLLNKQLMVYIDDERGWQNYILRQDEDGVYFEHIGGSPDGTDIYPSLDEEFHIIPLDGTPIKGRLIEDESEASLYR